MVINEQTIAGAAVRAYQHAREGHAPKVTPIKGQPGAYAVHSRVSGNLYAAEVVEANDGTYLGSCSCAARKICYHLVCVVAVHEGLASMRERSRRSSGGLLSRRALSALARNAGANVEDFPVYSDERPAKVEKKADGPLVTARVPGDPNSVMIGGVRWRI